MTCPYQTTHCRQAQELRSRWFAFASEHRGAIKPRHAALFFYFLECYQSNGKESAFELNTSEAMAMMGISSRNTYKKTLDELSAFGFIVILKKAENQYNNTYTLSFGVIEDIPQQSISPTPNIAPPEIRSITTPHEPPTAPSSPKVSDPKEPIKEEDPTTLRFITTRVIDDFNRLCPSLPPIVRLSDRRKKKLSTRLQEIGSYEKLLEVFKLSEESPYLTGRNAHNWKADFDWLVLNDENWIKVLEGKYKARAVSTAYTFDHLSQRNDPPSLTQTYRTTIRPTINDNTK